MARERERIVAENEALFRATNERMAQWKERDRDAVELYFCECGNPECNEKVRLRRSEYERVRREPARFFVVRGHEILDVETVIEQHPDRAVVEKTQHEARAIAEEMDPRQS